MHRFAPFDFCAEQHLWQAIPQLIPHWGVLMVSNVHEERTQFLDA